MNIRQRVWAYLNEVYKDKPLPTKAELWRQSKSLANLFSVLYKTHLRGKHIHSDSKVWLERRLNGKSTD